MMPLLAVLVLLFGIGLPTAKAMPLQQLQSNLIIPAASGCGLGVHRGPLDGCFPIQISPGDTPPYRTNYYVGYVSRGVCEGRGTHVACNRFGLCWVACN